MNSYKITLCSSFYDANRLFRFVFLDYKSTLLVTGYEYYTNNFYQVTSAYTYLDQYYNKYIVSSVHLGIVQYHGFMPEIIRESIISNQNAKALFEQMHTIVFFLYTAAIYTKYEQVYWYKLILKMCSELKIEVNNLFGNLNNSKNTANLRSEQIIDVIANMIDIDANLITIKKNHIFKFLKFKHYPIGKFILQQHTIGSHYYTSRCLFITMLLNSRQYCYFIIQLDKLRSKLGLLAPEFKIVFEVNITDSENLFWSLGQNRLGLGTWLISSSKHIPKLQNYIF